MSDLKRAKQTQFRLSNSLDHALEKEADRRGVSKNELAKKFVIAALTDAGTSTFKSDTHIRHSASANYILIYLSVFFIMQQNPSLSEEQATKIANEFIFSKATSRVQALLQQLGSEE